VDEVLGARVACLEWSWAAAPWQSSASDGPTAEAVPAHAIVAEWDAVVLACGAAILWGLSLMEPPLQ